MREGAHFPAGTGPHPRPTTHAIMLSWVAGRRCGPGPAVFKRALMALEYDLLPKTDVYIRKNLRETVKLPDIPKENRQFAIH